LKEHLSLRLVGQALSVSIAHAALDMAAANYPSERFTLRNGALVIREYKPTQDRGG